MSIVGDLQYVLLLDEDDAWIDYLVWQCSDSHVWQEHRYDLSEYAGRTIKLLCGVYNDGGNGVTGMYLDAVSLEACGPGLSTE